MLKKILLFSLLSVVLTACGGNSANVANEQANSTAGGGNVANTTNTVNVNVTNTNVNTANAKPVADNSPKRIAFGKGQNWGTSSVTLAPNATQLFIVSAKTGQTMDVESSSKEVAINLRKGKAQTTEDFGYLNAELQANGDYVFEVKNTSKKEVKTSIKVTIEGGQAVVKKDDKKANSSEIDESDSTVKDDDDVLPPPSETPKKKDN